MKPSHITAIRKLGARRARGGSRNHHRTVHATPISSLRFNSSGTRYEPAIRTVAMPCDTNPAGDIFGGWLMSQMDLAAGVVAARHAHGRCATVCVDAIEFQRPVHVMDGTGSDHDQQARVFLAENLLDPPAAGDPNASAAGLISRGLASGEKSGYRYTLVPTEVGYTINANPVAFNNTGRRTFYSDQSLITHQNSTAEPASAASPEVDAK